MEPLDKKLLKSFRYIYWNIDNQTLGQLINYDLYDIRNLIYDMIPEQDLQKPVNTYPFSSKFLKVYFRKYPSKIKNIDTCITDLHGHDVYIPFKIIKDYISSDLTAKEFLHPKVFNQKYNDKNFQCSCSSLYFKKLSSQYRNLTKTEWIRRAIATTKISIATEPSEKFPPLNLF